MCKVNRLTFHCNKINQDREPVLNSNGIIFDSLTKIGYYNYMKSLFLIICLSVLLLTGGCAELQGKLIKTYQLQYNEAVQASTDALENLEISILTEKGDELGTEILARRGDGTPRSPLSPAPGSLVTWTKMFQIRFMSLFGNNWSSRQKTQNGPNRKLRFNFHLCSLFWNSPGLRSGY